ncbi:hypothetical protein Bhyg_02511 [Pseudolycoriella hygida]|uniref:Uncharacterized protein n=1 Tax=Pseudolycoriella hygida TaxID=35572 RepID=A0A9Q0S6Q2_9DIPT|nr:hypothetical protein Bhyg_02511 [Pseudolycoriella hygida]
MWRRMEIYHNELITSVTETEKAAYSVSVVSNESNVCALEAITIFDDQNDLLRRLCQLSASSSLNVVTIQNGVVKSDLTLSTLCTEGSKGLLSWISWQDFIEKVRPLLSVDNLPQLVVRNSSIGSASEADPFSEVLIEMLPINYKLIDMKRSAWNNITFIETVSLGDSKLDNPSDVEKHIEGEIIYSFPIESNVTFLSNYPIKGLPVEMSDGPDDGKHFIVGSGFAYVFSSTFPFERLVPASKALHVSLKGTFGIHEYDIEGRIISIFGKNTDGSTIEESHVISARVVSLETYDIKESFSFEDYAETTTEEDKPTTLEELPIAIPHISEPLYPGFRKYFYVACFLMSALILVVFTDIMNSNLVVFEADLKLFFFLIKCQYFRKT